MERAEVLAAWVRFKPDAQRCCPSADSHQGEIEAGALPGLASAQTCPPCRRMIIMHPAGPPRARKPLGTVPLRREQLVGALHIRSLRRCRAQNSRVRGRASPPLRSRRLDFSALCLKRIAQGFSSADNQNGVCLHGIPGQYPDRAEPPPWPCRPFSKRCQAQRPSSRNNVHAAGATRQLRLGGWRQSCRSCEPQQTAPDPDGPCPSGLAPWHSLPLTMRVKPSTTRNGARRSCDKA